MKKNLTQELRNGGDFILQALDSDNLLQVYRPRENGWCNSLPEVTGYAIPTLIKISEKLFDDKYLNKALKMADALVDCQMDDGGYQSFDKTDRYVFDTSQVMHGLYHAYKKTNNDKYKVSINKCLDFLSMMQDHSGAFYCNILDGSPKNANVSWNQGFTYFYAMDLPYYIEVGEIFPKALTIADKFQSWLMSEIKRYPNYIIPSAQTVNQVFSHPLGYMLTGLIDSVSRYGEHLDLVENICINSVLPKIKDNGFFPCNYDEKEESCFSYLSGQSQIGYVLRKLYNHKRVHNYRIQSEKLLSFYQLAINNSKEDMPELKHGAYQYVDCEAKLSERALIDWPCQVNTWATKFYLDALLEMMHNFLWMKTSQKKMDFILEIFPVLKDKTVIEPGGCRGHLCLAMAQEGAWSTIIDIDPSLKDQTIDLWDGCFEKVNDYFVMDFQNHDGVYDIVHNAGVLQVYDWSGRKNLLSKMWDMVKPGGLLVIFTPDVNHPAFRSSMYWAEQSKYPCPDSFLPLFEECGIQGGEVRWDASELTEDYDFITTYAVKGK